MDMAFTSSTRRSFFAGAASFSALAGAVSISGRAAQVQSAAATAQSASGQTGSTPAPPKEPPMPQTAPPYDKATINLIGPKPGYTPQVGTIVTMLTWMERAVLGPTRSLKQQDLDFLFDKNANTIGALMLHLAATETYYQMNTFDGMKWDSWSDDIKKKWDPAMNLGDAGRATIKGHDRDYYVNILHEVREKTLAEFRKKEDVWFLAADKGWPWGPTNNLCKWFHVCEHEAHHTGQIALLRKRLPGAKPDSGSGA
jgi:hypothetical protein